MWKFRLSKALSANSLLFWLQKGFSFYPPKHWVCSGAKCPGQEYQSSVSLILKLWTNAKKGIAVLFSAFIVWSMNFPRLCRVLTMYSVLSQLKDVLGKLLKTGKPLLAANFLQFTLHQCIRHKKDSEVGTKTRCCLSTAYRSNFQIWGEASYDFMGKRYRALCFVAW